MKTKKFVCDESGKEMCGTGETTWGFAPGLFLLSVLTVVLLGSPNEAAANATNNTAPPFIQAPPIGNDTSAEYLFVVEPGGSLRFLTDPTQGPYDGVEDTLVAVQNNSNKKVASIPLRGFQFIFGFDGDGLASYVNHSYGPSGYEGPGTSFSNISSDQKSGVVNFNPPLAPGASAYFSLEDALVSSCPGLVAPANLKQGDTNWSSMKLGASQATIGGYGCYITSSAMLINYHANKNSVAFQTDPAQLAAWLAATNGFDANGNVIVGGEALIAAYARANGVFLHYTGMVDHRDDFTLDQYLCNGQPPVIYVGNPHWVFCTGQTNVNGTASYSTEDPDSYPSGDNLLGGFNNTYGAIDTYSDASGDLTGLYLVAHSPVELVLTSPDGGQTGLNPTTGTTLDSIPSSGYKALTIANDANSSAASLPLIKRLNVVTPVDGNYILTIYGTGSGSFTIDIAADDVNGNRQKATIKGHATKGSKVCYQIAYQSGVLVSAAAPTQASIITVTPTSCISSGGTIEDLLSTVRTAGQTRAMNPKASVRLMLFLKAAKVALDQGNNANAKNSLNGFIQAVNVYAGKSLPLIPSDMAASLISTAQGLIP